jgi:hypothetical protein
LQQILRNNKQQQNNNTAYPIKVKIVNEGILLTLNIGKQNDNQDYFLEKSEEGINLCVDQIKNYLTEKIV